MKKLLLILLCLPLLIFSQEEKTYKRTMSISQFAEELKEAAHKGVGYTLESCDITFDTILDKKYLKRAREYGVRGESNIAIGELSFSAKSKITIRDCRASFLIFKNCSFGEIEMASNNIARIEFIESNIKDLSVTNYKSKATIARISLSKSDVKRLFCSGSYYKKDDDDKINYTSLNIDSSRVVSCRLRNLSNILLQKNTLSSLYFSDTPMEKCIIQENKFIPPLEIAKKILIQKQDARFNRQDKDLDKNVALILHGEKYGIYIDSEIEELRITYNTFQNSTTNNDSIFNSLLRYYNTKSKPKIVGTFPEKGKWQSRIKWWEGYIDFEKDSLEIESGIFYNDSIEFKKKLKFLKKYVKEHSINLAAERNKGTIQVGSAWKTEGWKFENLEIMHNDVDLLAIQSTNVSDLLNITNNKIDSIFIFSRNILPKHNKIELNDSLINKLGFLNYGKIYHGNSLFKNIDRDEVKSYKSKTSDLIAQYKQFISIFDLNGSDQKSVIVSRLKDVMTNQKMFRYYEYQNTSNWFNWKGSEFLKWYSDYGMNPFKALSYCFWTMLYFALFYFFFYSEWDKIDRGFLIKRFNSVMDYFTTEKRIEDFYSSTYDKEMSTFTEFKETLDKNKVYMPAMLASLAKPIYQLSLLRYRLLNFSYKKAEFMAGRKWVDLEKKDRYWIGALTFFLTLTYIIYLVFIRALNSIVLSINAFSTLGFGQIPVRGFTKYVAIIEGFVGWFMLSVFIVSLLSQMMTV